MSAGNGKEMFHACEEGDIKLVKYYLQAGVDPNYQHPEYMTTVLIESVRAEKIDLIKLFLEFGADPHVQEIWGTDTAVTAAESIGNGHLLALLQEQCG